MELKAVIETLLCQFNEVAYVYGGILAGQLHGNITFIGVKYRFFCAARNISGCIKLGHYASNGL